MKLAHTLTFAGTNFDRADHLRGDTEKMFQDPNAKIAIIWRGKPLLDIETKALTYVSSDHPVLKASKLTHLFMGLDKETPVFAVDISDWDDPRRDEEKLGQFLDDSTNQHPDLPETQAFHDLRDTMIDLTPRDAELSAIMRGMFEWQKNTRFCTRCGGANAWGKAGWLATCTKCEAPHFPRTDPVVIMLVTKGNSVLLGRAHTWPDGMYSCLAGFMEPGETIEAAVRREVMEETGITVGDVTYLTSQPWVFPASLMIGCHGEALSSDITIDPIEIDDAKWVSRETIIDVYSGVDVGISAPRAGSIAEFLLRNWVKDTLD